MRFSLIDKGTLLHDLHNNELFGLLLNLKPNQFLLNIGRFSGAELKSIEEIRRLSRTGADVDWETSARTYALEKNIQDNTYFENSLLPFGWLLCELVD